MEPEPAMLCSLLLVTCLGFVVVVWCRKPRGKRHKYEALSGYENEGLEAPDGSLEAEQEEQEQEEEEEEAEGQIPPTVDWADSEAGGYIAAASDLSSASGVGTSRRSAAGC